MVKAGDYEAWLLLPGDSTPFGEVVDCVGAGPNVELTVKHTDATVTTALLDRHKVIHVGQ